MEKKVFVSGCYDMLHSGHVAFFKAASQYGKLYVGIGSDSTIQQLKHRKTVYSEAERLYMVKSIRYVTDACINSGSGYLDFVESVDRIKPDVFVVNSDGGSEEKRQFCKERGIEYVELERTPDAGLEARSTTSLRTNVKSHIPYRLDLAGTWIDQPYVSEYGSGWALTISLEPTHEYMERGGMSTSTRNAIKKIWPYELPNYHEEMLAKLVFCFENEPTKNEHVSGAQDAIGICMSGLTRHFYDRHYWPEKIEACHDDKVLSWLEQHICLIPTFPRPNGFSVIKETHISYEGVKALSDAANECWDAIMAMDLEAFARAYQASFEAQISMFPLMMSDEIKRYIDKYGDKILAYKLSGAGGGGYVAAVYDGDMPEGALPITIRRRHLD
jgi:cytidyltransferase-like protein